MIRNLFLLSLAAYGYDWGIGAPGSTFHYRFTSFADFTANQKSAIDAGFAAWNAGAGQIVRGADVTIVKDADTSSGCYRSNGLNQVCTANQAWFDSHYASFIAVTIPGVDDVDVIFDSDVAWCDDLPAACASGSSIGESAIHEMGHHIGFNHEDDNIATMNSSYPNGGDISAEYRINEDDSVGLQAHKGDSSTGKDLMLSKFAYDNNGNSSEKWTLAQTYDKSNVAWNFGNAPANILAIIEGTSTQTPLVEWRVVSSGNCFDGVGTEYTVGTRNPTISPNLPFSIGPNSWDFSGVPAGSYTLCAKIDADDSISETSEVDNQLRGEATITVQE